MARTRSIGGLRELLAFYREAGADEALVDEAPDRFQEGTRNAGAVGSRAHASTSVARGSVEAAGPAAPRAMPPLS